MIHPSYVDLMEVVNKDVEEGETPVINSRYSIVMATAKRARQIIEGDEPLVKVSRGEKPLSTAVAELNQGMIRILSEDEIEEDYIEADENAEITGEEMTEDVAEVSAEEEISAEEEPAAEETPAEEFFAVEEMPEDEVAEEADLNDAEEAGEELQ